MPRAPCPEACEPSWSGGLPSGLGLAPARKLRPPRELKSRHWPPGSAPPPAPQQPVVKCSNISPRFESSEACGSVLPCGTVLQCKLPRGGRAAGFSARRGWQGPRAAGRACGQAACAWAWSRRRAARPEGVVREVHALDLIPQRRLRQRRSVLGSWGKTMRDAVRNKTRWERAPSPTQDPSTYRRQRLEQTRSADLRGRVTRGRRRGAERARTLNGGAPAPRGLAAAAGARSRNLSLSSFSRGNSVGGIFGRVGGPWD